MNKHDVEYVRLDRDGTDALEALPSHQGVRRGPVQPPAPRPHRLVARIGILLVGLIALLGIGVGLIIMSGALERTANGALERMVPETLDADLGGTRVRLHWPPSLAVTYSDVALRPADALQAEPLAGAERLAVAIDPWSLVGGEPRISGIDIAGLRADWPALDDAIGGPDEPMAPMRLTQVPAQFDRFFGALRRWGAVHLHHEGGLRLTVEDATIALAETGMVRDLAIQTLTGLAEDGAATISGTTRFNDDPVTLAGRLTVPDAVAAGPAELALTLDGLPLPWRRLPTLFSNVQDDHSPGAERPTVPTTTNVQMIHRGQGRADNVLRVVMQPRDLALKLAAEDFVPLAGTIGLDYDFRADAVTLMREDWQLGRSALQVFARITDAGVEDPDAASGTWLMPVAFDVVANNGTLAPRDSPSPPLRFAARAEGSYDFTDKLFDFEGIELQSPAGDIRARGQLSLLEPVPTAVFQIQLEDMSTTALKQFWPASVARAARRWVLANLAGGRVVQADFDIVEPLRRRVPGTERVLRGDTAIDLRIEGARFDIAGDIPPVRDAAGRVQFANQTTTVTIDEGTVFLPSGRTARARDGVLVINPMDENGQVLANIDLYVDGEADAIGEVIAYRPINAKQFRDYDEAGLSGSVDAHIMMDFVMNPEADAPPPDWSVDLVIENGASAEPFDGRTLSGLNGTISADAERAIMDLSAVIDGLPARIDMVVPFGDSEISASRDIALSLGDDDRARLAPGLDALVRGATPVRVEGEGERMSVEADLTGAELLLPWIGWSKGPGVDARAAFDLVLGEGTTTLEDFRLTGAPFAATGRIDVGDNGLQRARFGSFALNEGDQVSVDIARSGPGYAIDIEGASLDARALIRHIRRQMRASGAGGDGATPVSVSARIGTVRGFGGEVLRDMGAEVRLGASGLESLSITGTTASLMPFSVALNGQGAARQIRIEAFDAGQLLRFIDLYGQIRGGVLNVALQGRDANTLGGAIQIVDFEVFNEPRLAQLTNSRAADGSQSLREAVQRDIDVSTVRFDLASGNVILSPGGLDLSEGIVRGPLIGFALQGKVFDGDGNMRLTGTFLPAYGLNSLFADIPILGLILGNGSDRGLIGVTFKLEGPTDGPQVTVNPLSVIAPGVFRSIFEFR